MEGSGSLVGGPVEGTPVPLLDGFIEPTFLIAFVVAVISAFVITAIAALVFRMAARKRAWARAFIRLCRRPFRIVILIGALWIVTSVYLTTTPDLTLAVDFIMRALFIAAATWLVAALMYFFEEVIAARYRIDVRDNRVARRVRTQLRMLRRISVVVVIVCAIGTVLLSIPGAAAVGASLFASAGLLSVVAGLAAQSSLANVFAGMQLSFSNALRVDDVVIVENEWGRIEEITLTYIVVHIWDDRRMVLPSTYFTTTPFQNWTRRTSELLGSVEFDVDWRVSTGAMREELNRIVAQTELWDRRVAVLQVTDAVGGFVRIRVLVSAGDAAMLWDLRCIVRENLVEWLVAENPDALPLGRVEVRQPARRPTTSATGAAREQRPVTEAPGLFSGDSEAVHRGEEFTRSMPIQEISDQKL
ncbi:mechanosensitive ion channel [Cryobacterium sp. MDB2-10]|nr:mechanosensitive ion channel [Cryobacterium sp. MDB2-A-1]TFC08497.1 mechanosensitive ion channel [Cryobacterium sp. MDB2-33-2]TFC08760.1 mechanosensitive ion channel [Cryobacterium sp. MDB2-A-2]TFC22365.1 mechanosensitive ion channel [Cryobacterium sp. MDB2-10]